MSKQIPEFRTSICPICTSIFQDYTCKKRVYCSRSCKHKGQKISLGNGEILTCFECGSKFYKSKANNNAKYCSVICFRKVHAAKTTKCPICNKEMPIRRKTCSRTCMATSYKTKLLKENNPNWKGGTFFRENTGVGNPWREIVLSRDKYQCTKCGAKDWNKKPSLLHTHHIISHKKGGGNSPNNLITLCFVCHFEGEHGYKLSQHMQELASTTNCGYKYRRLDI